MLRPDRLCLRPAWTVEWKPALCVWRGWSSFAIEGYVCCSLCFDPAMLQRIYGQTFAMNVRPGKLHLQFFARLCRLGVAGRNPAKDAAEVSPGDFADIVGRESLQ
jgi:hypothetical protein